MKKLKDYLLENYVNEFGNLDIRGLDFSDFDGHVVISDIKVKGDLYQHNHKVEGNLYQDFQKVEGNLWQDEQKVRGNLHQDRQKVEGVLFQDKKKKENRK